jgi:ubiquinone/menaquinone biosynthesis C-methylase UbiE
MTTSFAHDTPELAETYDRLSDSQFAGGKRLVERMGVKAGDRVLDIGCGTGRLARWIASIAGPDSVVGIDPLPDRVQVARANSPGVKFDVGTAEDLSAFGDASFDALCMSAVFHWIGDKPKALREARRVLKPGGRLGLTTPPKELRGTSTTAKLVGPLLGEKYTRKFNPLGFGIAQSGCTVTELVNLVVEAQLDLLELHVVQRTHSFARGKDVVDFLQSSSFGNFTRLVTEDARADFEADLAAAFDARKGPEGITMQDHALLLVAASG